MRSNPRQANGACDSEFGPLRMPVVASKHHRSKKQAVVGGDLPHGAAPSWPQSMPVTWPAEDPARFADALATVQASPRRVSARAMEIAEGGDE